MVTWRRILCPTDFSDASRAALDTAAGLARQLKAELHLLHVYQMPGWGLPEGVVIAGPETLARLLSSLDTELTRWKNDVLADGPLVVTTATAMGTPHTEIVRVAHEQKLDLIVMGTHGRTGFQHALLGSIAEKVVRKADCPVLTVRPRSAS